MNDREKADVKTSRTHPLPLPAVTTPGHGKIAITMCPGKRQPEAITGPWDRDLAVDLAAIVDFGAQVVITLMETEELAAAGVPVPIMKAAVIAAGLKWLHWPVGDFETPDAPFERLWVAEAPAIRDLLAAGGRVAIHCRGGRGRSGLIAARFLVELGMGNDAAIAAIRAVQPLAIETPVQENHAKGFRAKLNAR